MKLGATHTQVFDSAVGHLAVRIVERPCPGLCPGVVDEGRVRYPSGMKTSLVAILVVGLLGYGALADVAAGLGSRFADAYTAFAPLYTLYRAYAEHLFQGVEVEVPHQLSMACGRFAEELAFLHVDLVSQTSSSIAEAMPFLIHLRSETAAFCSLHQGTLDVIAGSPQSDLPLLKQASEAGMFAAISALNDGLESVFSGTLEGFSDGEDAWAFAVTFAVRTLLGQEKLDRLGSNLKEIFYGSEEAGPLPVEVPVLIGDAMSRLVERSGRPLSSEDAKIVLDDARTVYDYLIEGHVPDVPR